MNAAAWIALGGAVVLVVTNVVVITRFLTKLEGRLSLDRAEIEGKLNVASVEHKNLLDSTNAAMGRLQADQQKHEQRTNARLRDVERIIGKAKMFTVSEDE